MKREKNCIPRLAAMLLCLCLCAALLAGCGKTEKNLWGKTVTAELAHVPAEAFDVEDARLCGFSPDGSKALISYNPETYLYDMNTGKRIYLTPGDAMTEEALREGAGMALMGIPEEQREQKQEEINGLQGRELVTAALSVGWYGEKTSLRALDLPGADGRWMRTMVQGSGLFLMLDCESGKVYGRIEGQYEDARGDLLLAKGPFPQGELTLVNVKTGEETSVPAFREGYGQRAAAFLPDGGVVAILRETDVGQGQPCLLVTRSAKGEEQTIELGQIRVGLPDDILCLGEDTLLLRTETVPRQPACLIQRSTGEVWWLTLNGRKIEKHSLSDPDFADPLHPPAGQESVDVIAALPDGKTVVLQTFDGTLYLFQPETMETRVLLQGVDGQGIPPLLLNSFTFNGYDRIWSFGAPRGEDWRDVYIQFHVKD